MKSKIRKTKIHENNEPPEYLLQIPEHFKENINADILDIITKFNTTLQEEEQISSIHDLVNHIKNPTLNINIQEIVLKILVNLFVNSDPKNAVKKTISRSIKTFDTTNELSVEIETFIKIVNEENIFSRYNECVISINECFNNFPGGVKSINLILTQVYEYLIKCLKCFVDHLSSETLSPIDQQSFYNYIHNVTRSLVSVSQQCDNINQIIPLFSNDLIVYCVKIFNNSGVFFDTKNNCGIVLIIALNCREENGYISMLQLTFKEIDSTFNINQSEINDDIVISCIYAGVLNTVDPNKMCNYNETFEESYIFKMCEKLLDISKNSADKSSIILAVNRTLLLVSKALKTLKHNDFTTIVTYLLEHVWTQLDHYVDSIRHLSKSILSNFVKTCVSYNQKGNDILSYIIDSIFKHLISEKRAKYVAISVISSEIGCDVLLQRKGDLMSLIMSDLSSDNSSQTYIISCCENLMRQYLKEVNTDIWFTKWVQPILIKLKSNLINCDESNLQNLLITAIKLKPDILEQIIKELSCIPSNEIILSTILKSTIAARKLGLVPKSEDVKKWRNLLDYQIIEKAKCDQNDEIRISCLCLMVESHKSTELFNKFEFNFILSYLHYNINSQEPSTKQRILFLMRKFLTRYTESYYGIIRDYKKLSERYATKSVFEMQYEKLKQQKDEYEYFIFNLRVFIFENLFSRSSYSRRNNCLELLTLMEPIINDVLKNVEFTPPKIWKEEYVNAILLCLEDSYEVNQHLATKLLQKAPIQYLKIHDMDSTRKFLKKAVQLTNMVQPAYSQSAAYYFELALCSPVISEILIEEMCLDFDLQKYTKHFILIKFLFNKLQEQVGVGKKSLFIAAGRCPMYGTLFCIRHLLLKYLFTNNVKDDHWKHLMEEIIDTCFEISEIVGPVVNNSSPEGHLPMDQSIFPKEVIHEEVSFSEEEDDDDDDDDDDNSDEDYEHDDDEEENEMEMDMENEEVDEENINASMETEEMSSPIQEDGNGQIIRTVTSQMLLVCSWRSIKEVSLLLGEIALNSTIAPENDNGLITEDQMYKIGEHFTILLTETKHRGAFEQAYVGFCKLCTRLWKCKSEKLHQLPVMWLNDIICAIRRPNAENRKLCATRRSAGVPFMIQAIVSSELQTGGSTNFHYCMKTLLEMANHPGDKIEIRTHSMNILRALYRHTQLGEQISEYTGEGLIVSITGFSRKTWAERNSATLLFSSLMTRIFGVQRNKDSDQINIRNRMTARVFFMRNPTLHSFLLNSIKDLTDVDCEPYKSIALYPILLLLARLYPANNDEQSDQLLQDFLPFIKLCANSKNLKTRELAAKAIIPLVPTDQQKTLYLKELFMELHKSVGKRNFMHGILLQIYYILPTITDFQKRFDICKIIKNTSWVLTFDNPNSCAVICALYMKIVSRIIPKSVVDFFTNSHKSNKKTEKQKIFEDLFIKLIKQDKYVQSHCIVGISLYNKESTYLQLNLLRFRNNGGAQDPAKISDFLIMKLLSQNEDVLEIVLNFLLYYLNEVKSSKRSIEFILETFDIPEDERNLAKVFAKTCKPDAIYKHMASKLGQKMHIIFDYICANYTKLTNKAYIIMSYFKKMILKDGAELAYKNYFSTLVKAVTSHDDEQASAIVVCIKVIMKNTESFEFVNDIGLLDHLFEILNECATPRRSVYCRYAVAQTFSDEFIARLFLEQGHLNIGINNVIMVWKIIMQLSIDPEPIIRNKISELDNTKSIAEKTREIFMDKCINYFRHISTTKLIHLLLFWCISDFEQLNSDDNDEGHVYEKGETSSYVEDMFVSRLASQKLSHFVRCETISDFHQIFSHILNILLMEQDLWDVDVDELITIFEKFQKEIVCKTGSDLIEAIKKFVDSHYGLELHSKIKYICLGILPENFVWEE